MKEPKLDTEFEWSVFKGMFILLIFTNMLWCGILGYYVHKSIADVSHNIEMTQDGQDNNQSITNG